MRGSDCTLTRAIGFPREKCLTGTFLLFIGLPSIYRLRFTLLVLVTLVLSGCLRVISVDYVPANPYRGQGSVAIGPFQYSASQNGKIGPRHIESNPQGMGQFYLSKDVAEFLADAVAGELTFSGYSVNSTAVLNISAPSSSSTTILWMPNTLLWNLSFTIRYESERKRPMCRPRERFRKFPKVPSPSVV